MTRPITDEEKAATASMPPLIAEGWIKRSRAHELLTKRGDERTSRITEILVGLAEAMQP